MRREPPVSFLPSLDVKTIGIVVLTVLIAACSKTPPDTVNARPMTGQSGIKGSDCVEARKRAAAKPDLDVDRLPTPRAQKPAVFQKMPAAVKRQVDRRGAVVKVDVLIDTIGRPVMRTFTVVESTPHPWLAENVKSVIPKWRFSPAELAGCKVPRVYKFSATSPKRG